MRGLIPVTQYWCYSAKDDSSSVDENVVTTAEYQRQIMDYWTFAVRTICELYTETLNYVMEEYEKETKFM